jgi:hypothetical protein
VEERIFAQGKLLEQVRERRRVRRPGFSDALEGVLELSGIQCARRFLVDPVGNGGHESEKGSEKEKTERLTLNA